MTKYWVSSFWAVLFLFPQTTALQAPRGLASKKPQPAAVGLVETIAGNRNWGLNPVFGINAPGAWKITKGRPDVVVAVVDTGIDFSHPDLAQAAWKNPGESGKDARGQDKATNGVDDDGDGLVDNVEGWDYVLSKPLKGDTHGHGTHISGIIAASNKNRAGAMGVAPGVKLVGFRYYSDTASGRTNLANGIKAFKQAVAQGVSIINYSGGGAEPSEEEKAVLEEAARKGILIVAAAGNEYSNTDKEIGRYYPCSYQLANVICVGNSNIKREKDSSSNYGRHSIHVFAPGQNVYSTLPNKKYGTLTGTSQATAFVSGVAALILSKNPQLKPEQVISLMMNTVEFASSLQDYSISAGIVNAGAAVAKANQPIKMYDKRDFMPAAEVGRAVTSEIKVLKSLKALQLQVGQDVN